METTIQDAHHIKCIDKQDLDKKRDQIRRSAFQGMFKNDDGSHNLIHDKSIYPKEGDYFLCYRGFINIVSEVGETRNHKGIFEKEEDRKKITPVKGIPVFLTSP
ncbi:hypothetical protein CMU02_09050 [Elizabethkingia anophelis]|uniref:hypothetical protein n=1 Tax=Elizabethkingia anophelis TaxID=1117645 RepID=UPI00293CC6AF|nr:hypothetical protein [Elizabethkingia anophelis]MDV3904958.1 hypothetical protein [Elizabethkingia anophelis]